jgi:hypothetical protein
VCVRAHACARVPRLALHLCCVVLCVCFGSLQAVLAVLVSQFSLTLKPGAVVIPRQQITMRPFPGLPMILHKVAEGTLP